MALRGAEIVRKKIPIKNDLARQGLNQVSLLGRWQIIEGSPRVILDACHNSAGAICLRENLVALSEKPEIWLGVLGEDRAKEIVDVVLDFASSITLFEVEQPRACTVDYLRSLIPDSFRGKVIDFNLEKAKDKLKNSRSNGTILDNWVYLFDWRYSTISHARRQARKNELERLVLIPVIL